MGGTLSTFKLHDDEDTGPKKEDKEENLSKTALKNKKRREAAKKKRDEEEAAGKQENNQSAPQNKNNEYRGAAGLLFNPELEKEKKKINDKLNSIKSLKEMQAQGKQLEKNQLEKLAREAELLEELKKLSVK